MTEELANELLQILQFKGIQSKRLMYGNYQYLIRAVNNSGEYIFLDSREEVDKFLKDYNGQKV